MTKPTNYSPKIEVQNDTYYPIIFLNVTYNTFGPYLSVRSEGLSANYSRFPDLFKNYCKTSYSYYSLQGDTSMRIWNTSLFSQTKHPINYLKVSANILLQVTGIVVALTADASAAFIGYYSPNNWNEVTNNSDGFVTSGAPDFIQIEGSANQSGSPGSTDFTIRVEESGNWSFNWEYESFDNFGDQDSAGYLLNGVYNQLTQNDTPILSGSTSIFVNQNDVIGYRVFTVDNNSDSGRLTISNFNAPTATAAVPFNFSPTLGVSLIAVWYGIGQVRKYWRFSKVNALASQKLSSSSLSNNQSKL
ncbi:MAG TPA: hypothetical protein DCY88_03545 [Cyanobacteria bacterium UBA11372]|nr:hypothetical protein [Cyanobacteria bacterium UBA11372]